MHTFVANLREHRVSCKDSGNGDMFTNINLGVGGGGGGGGVDIRVSN